MYETLATTIKIWSACILYSKRVASNLADIGTKTFMTTFRNGLCFLLLMAGRPISQYVCQSRAPATVVPDTARKTQTYRRVLHCTAYQILCFLEIKKDLK
ncbi:TPA: hypothetical protein ACH3X3_004250 [Trebouxia sp. C0006]